MQKLLYFILLIALTVISTVSFADVPLQEKAEKFYADRNYKAAITSYDSILKTGLFSAKLYYNIGNAYYKNNELGKAIYYYELSHKLDPNNEDVKVNLAIANSKKIDEIESKENFFVTVVKSGIVNLLSNEAWAYLSIISLIVCLSMYFLFFVSTSSLIKRIGFFGSVIFLIIFVFAMIFGFTALKSKNKIKFAIIVSIETKVQAEPTISSPSKFNLHEGTKVKVIESNKEWTNIKLENGNEGWVKTMDVGLF